VEIAEEISIISTAQQVRSLLERAERRIAQAEVPQQVADDISVALLEAVNNAIIHGNQRSYDKQVNVRLVIGDRKVELKVSDEGQGFDPSKLEDPCRPENIYQPNGRGLFFIRKLMDEVEINSSMDGSEIVMRKYWGAIS